VQVELDFDLWRSSKEDREVETTVNGKAGLSNRYGQYFEGWRTLDEKPIPREDDSPAETSAS
jgi:hypothetical protein